MISVKVSYTVKPEFVAQNKQNISIFLADFKIIITNNFLYNVYLQEDGITFLHISMYENEETQNEILNVASFKDFQEQRDQSGLVDLPKIEKITLIGSSLRTI